MNLSFDIISENFAFLFKNCGGFRIKYLTNRIIFPHSSNYLGIFMGTYELLLNL